MRISHHRENFEQTVRAYSADLYRYAHWLWHDRPYARAPGAAPAIQRPRQAGERQMNCLEFHREKLADPRRLSAEAQAHAHACASCAAFARSVDESDQGLEEVLASPVPDGL